MENNTCFLFRTTSDFLAKNVNENSKWNWEHTNNTCKSLCVRKVFYIFFQMQNLMMQKPDDSSHLTLHPVSQLQKHNITFFISPRNYLCPELSSDYFRFWYGFSFLCLKTRLFGLSNICTYKGNYGPEIPTKKGPYDFSSNSF